jgi:Tol biopolymer transport system component
VIDVASGAAQRLTDDRFAYFHPAYSPDGATIAFVTDQGPGTNLEQLSYGGYTLGLRDMATGYDAPPARSAGGPQHQPGLVA